MLKTTINLMAVTLAATSIAVSAQTASGRDEMFGQSPTVTESPSQSQRRVQITNTAASDLPTQDEGRGQPRTERDNAGGRRGDPRRGASIERRTDKAPVGGAYDDERARSDDELKKISEFQRFLRDRTGKVMPVFGAEFFAARDSIFAAATGAPVPPDHTLGPGDELLIRGNGTIDIDFRATVDRNGTISIPTVGTVVLAGVKAGDAPGVIRAAVGRLYKGVTVNVSFGRLRALTIYVVGQANRPGTYTVPSMSTLVSALFVSGGPNANGSLRRVQVKRGGRIAAELDLYSFIAKGDKSADIKLQDGDSIYIPPAAGFVALVGMVNSPAIYEIRGGADTVESLLDIAGGLPVVADPRRAFLERIDARKSQPRSVEQFALSGEGMQRSLKDGDVLNITSITPDFSNAVVLRGNVDQPVRAPFKPGMRVSDLIPSREYLITRESIQRQNSAIHPVERQRGKLRDGDRERDRDEQRDFDSERDQADESEKVENIAARIGGLMDEINWDYAVVERINREDLSVRLIPFNLGNVFANAGSADNVLLQAGDTVTVFSQTDVAVPIDKRRVFVRVEGEVKVPGVYQMVGGETVQALLARAGGPTSNAYLFGTAFYREQVRKEQEINLEKAANRLEAQMRSAQSKSIANVRALNAGDAAAAEAQRAAELALARETLARFRQLKPTGRIAFGLEPKERSFARLPSLKLENGDRLVVPPRPEFIHVFGAVNAETSPLWRPNSRVKDYLRQSGVTADADVENVFVMRTDGTVASRSSGSWMFGGVGGLEIMPGDSIVVPEKMDKETAWSKFTKGTREWAQIFANFGLGAAAIQTLRN